MRLWLCLASVIVFVLSEYNKQVDRCPDDTVCLVFGNDICSVRGVWGPAHRGYIWGPDTHCEYGNYGFVYSKLDIRPITPFKWKFVATLFRLGAYNRVVYPLENLVFNVGYAEIRIISDTVMEFKTDLTGLGRKTNFLNKRSTKFDTDGEGNHYGFEQYLFEIETDQELIDFFGPTVVFHSHDLPKLLQDEDFPELLMEKVAKNHRKVERCPCTRSCIVFMQNNPCDARVSQEFEGSGYVWKNNLECGRPTYEKLYSQIEFKPITATKWYVSTIVLDEGNGIRDLGFDFGKTAGLTFDESNAFFTYTREGKQIKYDCKMRHEKTFTSEFNKTSYKFKKYSFRMESDGVNITDINNSYVNFKKSGKSMQLNDDAFHEQLKQLKTPVEHRQIEPCSDGKACLVFVENDACSCNGEFPQPADSGYVWTKTSTCRRPTYEVLLSRIDFEPISTTKWKAVIITYYAPDKPRYQRDWQIGNIDINFGNARISAHSANAMSFGWTNREGTVTSSVRPMHHNADEDVITSEDAKSVETENGRPLTFKRYHFDIEAGGEELHQFFGPEIEFKLKGPNAMALAMNGTEFKKELGQISRETGLSTLTIVLIVIGVLLLLIIIVAIVIGVCFYCRTKSHRALHNVDARNTYRPIPSNPPIRANPLPSSNSSKSSECESQYITCSTNPKCDLRGRTLFLF